MHVNFSSTPFALIMHTCHLSHACFYVILHKAFFTRDIYTYCLIFTLKHFPLNQFYTWMVVVVVVVFHFTRFSRDHILLPHVNVHDVTTNTWLRLIVLSDVFLGKWRMMERFVDAGVGKLESGCARVRADLRVSESACLGNRCGVWTNIRFGPSVRQTNISLVCNGTLRCPNTTWTRPSWNSFQGLVQFSGVFFPALSTVIQFKPVEIRCLSIR